MEPKLTDSQKKILLWLERAGACSPSRLAAEMMTLPQDTWKTLNELAEMGLVVIRDDPDSADGTLVFAAPMSDDYKKAL